MKDTERELLAKWGAGQRKNGFFYSKIPDPTDWARRKPGDEGPEKNPIRFMAKRPFDYLLQDARGFWVGEAKKVAGKSLNFDSLFETHQKKAFDQIVHLQTMTGASGAMPVCLVFVATAMPKKETPLSALAKLNALVWEGKIFFALEFPWGRHCVGTVKIVDFISSSPVPWEIYRRTGKGTFRRLDELKDPRYDEDDGSGFCRPGKVRGARLAGGSKKAPQRVKKG